MQLIYFIAMLNSIAQLSFNAQLLNVIYFNYEHFKLTKAFFNFLIPLTLN